MGEVFTEQRATTSKVSAEGIFAVVDAILLSMRGNVGGVDGGSRQR